jgi:hypothetical protein
LIVDTAYHFRRPIIGYLIKTLLDIDFHK